jgi:uncharacterized membrane protein
MTESTIEDLRVTVDELRRDAVTLRLRIDHLERGRRPVPPRTLPVSQASPHTLPVPQAAPRTLPVPQASPRTLPVPQASPRTLPVPEVPLRTLPVREAPPAPRPALATPPVPRRPRRSVGDLIDARVLAWTGGLATLIGILLFLALAASHGWIDLPARVALAGAAAAALMAGGAWLHERRGRTEAALAMVGTGTAGLLATLVVASQAYGLISPLTEVVGSLVVGAAATALAIRWAGRAIGALGLIGGVLSPLLVGVPSSGATVLVVLVATAAAIAVVVWRRWTWLAVGAMLAGAPQWSLWLLAGQSRLTDIAALTAFACLGLSGAVATQRRSAGERTEPSAGERAEPSAGERAEPSAVALLTLNAAISALVGAVVLDAAGAGALLAALWMGALAGAHVLPAVLPAVIRRRPCPRFAELSCAIAVALADIAFGLVAHGILLVIGWSAAAIGCAWLARRRDAVATGTVSRTGAQIPRVGLAAHLGLALVRVAVFAPPAVLGDGGQSLESLLAIATLAAALLACAQLTGPAHRAGRDVLRLAGLAAIAYLTATVLDGPALVGAWAAEGVALCQLAHSGEDRLAHSGEDRLAHSGEDRLAHSGEDRLAHSGEDRLARIAGLAFLAGASAQATLAVAPPVDLLTGSAHLLDVALALGAVAIACLRIAHTVRDRPWRPHALIAGGAAAVLYLASVAVVTAFTHTSATSIDGLTIHQQGQVALSALWSVTGVAVLIVGLRLRRPEVRIAGLALLLITAAKVFLYDLSTLGSIERVISMIVLGLLLLAGAFAHQRLRPGPGGVPET